MREIQLTQGMVAKVDDEDYERLSRHKWYANKSYSVWYARRVEKLPDGKWVTIRMHREIMGAKPGQQLDHIDGNGLNNTRSNLRFATNQENARNRGFRSDNTSGFKGVSWNDQRGKWTAYIRLNGKQKHIGVFDSVVKAACAYDAAALDAYGQFARLNFPLTNT